MTNKRDFEEVRYRAKILTLMDVYVREHVEDEDFFDAWINTFPDGASPDDIEDIAEDIVIFDKIARLFGRVVSQYDIEQGRW